MTLSTPSISETGVESARQSALAEMVEAYNKDFIEAYALVIAEAQELPEQMNNEIRNAFTHLSRIFVSDSTQAISDEKAKGLGHIHRATRDCLKYTIFHLHQRLQTQHKWARVFHKAVNPDYCARSNKIKKDIIKIIADETKGIATESDWLNIIKESKELSDLYHTTYGIEFTAAPITAMGYLIRANILPFAIGVVSTLLWYEGKSLWQAAKPIIMPFI